MAGSKTSSRSGQRKSSSSRGSSRSSGGSPKRSRSSASRASGASQNSNGVLDTLKNAARKPSAPVLAAGAAAAGVAGGLVLKSRTRRHKILGVPLPRSIGKVRLSDLDVRSVAKTVGKASKQFGQTSKSVSKDIEQVGDQAERVGKILS
jgi:hypothetical protein